MKKLIAFWLLSLLFPAQNMAASAYNVKLRNHLYMNIQACQDGIFRVRLSPRDRYAENLMVRYGLQKTDWQPVACTVSDTREAFSLATKTCVLTVNKADGSLSLRQKNGKTMVSRVGFVRGTDPLTTALGKRINAEFAGLKVQKNNGIIGDDGNQKTLKDTIETGDYRNCSILAFSIKPRERFYGGGSTSREHIQHRGELLRMWATYQHTEIPQPFIVSSEGWGVFNNTTLKNFFDIGRFQSDILAIYNTTDEADFYLMAAQNMGEVIGQYTLITGRPYLQPKWAYGLCFGPNMLEDQFDILRDAAEFRRMGVPCDLIWLEPQWMERRYDFSIKKKWNYQKFSPEGYWDSLKVPKKENHRLFIGRLHGMGYRLGLWLCEDYDLSITEEDLVAKAEGRAQSGQYHWMDHLTKFIDNGVDGFKMDPARTIDEHPTRKYYNGYTDKTMHNLNQILLPKQMELMMRSHTNRRNWHHYTAGYAGTQHWGAATSGDNGGGKTALFDQINLGMSGFMNTSCDVMSVPKDQEMQSLHFGLFLPWVQINSWYSLMHPLYFGEKKQNMYRDYVRLRYALLPYIYSTAIEGALTGLPIVRAMPLEFPEDANLYDASYQYMFGKNLLVGIFSDTLYLPKGRWTDFWTGQTVQGGRTIKHTIPTDKAGLLFVREGAIIPMQRPMNYVGEHPLDTLTLKVFPKGRSTYTLLEDDGASYAYEKGAVAATKFGCDASNGRSIVFEVMPTKGQYKGMYARRTYKMEVYLPSKPTKVTVNGAPCKAFSYGNDGILRFDLPQKDVRKKAVAVIQ